MAFYNKSTNFAVKDSLTTGDPNKIVSGVEIDTEFSNIASGFSSVESSVQEIESSVQETIDDSLEPFKNNVFAVKQSTQTVTSTSRDFFEITGFTPGLSITIPSERSDAEIEIDVHLSFDGDHSTENDIGFEFALTDDQQTGGAQTIDAISRVSYEYELTGANDGNNRLFGNARMRARLSPGDGVHQFKLFARNRRQTGTVTLNIRGSSTEQNSTVLIKELV